MLKENRTHSVDWEHLWGFKCPPMVYFLMKSLLCFIICMSSSCTVGHGIAWSKVIIFDSVCTTRYEKSRTLYRRAIFSLTRFPCSPLLSDASVSINQSFLLARTDEQFFNVEMLGQQLFKIEPWGGRNYQMALYDEQIFSDMENLFFCTGTRLAG